MKLKDIKNLIEADAEGMTDCGNDNGWVGCLLFGALIVALASIAMLIL